MFHKKTPRLSALAAVAVSSMLLAGCTSSQADDVHGPVSPGHQIPETPDYPEHPSRYRAQVIDVLSGDTLRVQLVEAHYSPSVSPSGQREVVELDPLTIVVKDATFDAPAAGECGFEQAREHLITKVFHQNGPDWVNDEADGAYLVGLSRDFLDDADLPRTDTEGRQLYKAGYRHSLASDMLNSGHARIGSMIPTGSTVWERLMSSQSGAMEYDKGLWETCDWEQS